MGHGDRREICPAPATVALRRRRRAGIYRAMLSAPSPNARGNLFGRIRAWGAAHPAAALALAVFLALGPFLAKPFNMDDPLFIWTARQIHAHPFNPYGFDVNWYGTSAPMWSVTENPPLAGYYMALAAGILGWSETALHLAFLLPALAVVLGTHRLARRFCDRPMLAALAVLCAPVFLVSSATVMCDVLMLAFWIWAVVFWVEGLEGNDFWRLSAAGSSSRWPRSPSTLAPASFLCSPPTVGRGGGSLKVGGVSAHPAGGALRLPMGHARALPARPPFTGGGLRRSDARFSERRQSRHGFDRRGLHWRLSGCGGFSGAVAVARAGPTGVGGRGGAAFLGRLPRRYAVAKIPTGCKGPPD